MAPHAIISYDDTPNDQDALVLGHLLADAGARLTLAYVRHATELEHTPRSASSSRRRICSSAARMWLEDCIGVERRVVVSASTGEGLQVARRAGARRRDRVRLGLPHGRRPRRPRALGPDPARGRPRRARDRAGRRTASTATREIRHDRPARRPGDDAALETARELAGGARRDRDRRDEPRVDLLVVGSRSEAPHGPRDDHRTRRERDRERDVPGVDRRARRRRSSSARSSAR